MRQDESVAGVRNLAELESNEEVEKATRAALETLREQLAGNESSNPAAQLPEELKSFLEG